MDDVEVVSLLTAKICHDLAGPIGAINNGFEFLKEENVEMRERAYKLVDVSAKQAVSRLQFFRQIYGVVSTVGEANLSDLRSLTEQYLSHGKSVLDWDDESMSVPGIVITHQFAKIIMNLINLANYSLIYGGKITVNFQKSLSGKIITISALGANVKIDKDMVNILTNPASHVAITSQNIHIYLTKRLIDNIKASLKINQPQDRLDFVVEHFVNVA